MASIPGTDPAELRASDVLAALPPQVGAVAVRDGPRTVVAAAPQEVASVSGPGALHALDDLTPGWWAGLLSYDLGRCVEDFGSRLPATGAVPDVLLARFEARAVLDPVSGTRVEGRGESRHLLEEALDVAPGRREAASLSGWTSSLDRTAWEDAVRTILEHIAAGDCYQVNLTRQLTCPVTPDPIALHASLASAHPAPHGGFVRLGDVSVVSASPELFLRSDGTTLVTRPIKGTGMDAAALAASAKDTAENVMIVDLARNDLGRVCAYGSVRVAGLCEVEAHPGLVHLVSTVQGTLRADASPGEIVASTFPPASVTGCPKPEVLKIIERLEPVRRGAYCGAVGWIDTRTRAMDLNVAIRTFTVAGGVTTFGVGGGIVADSDPGAEWEETELKAARLLAVASGDQTSR